MVSSISRLWPTALIAVVGLLGCAHSVAPPPPVTGASTWPEGWVSREFPGKSATAYQMEQRSDQPCVAARAVKAASILRRSVDIAPAQLRHIEFSFWLDRFEHPDPIDEDVAEDAPARLVLAFEGDVDKLPLRTRMMFDLAQALTGEPPPYATLVYTWDESAPVETVRNSPRTDRIRKLVVGTGLQHRGRWLRLQRDVVADFERVYGEKPGRLVGIGFLTDADNYGGEAQACYGSVRMIGVNGEVLPGSLLLPSPAALTASALR